MAKSTTHSFQSDHLMPHRFEELQLAKGAAEVSESRHLQLDISKAPSKVTKVNTKTIITSIIDSDVVLLGLCANITSFLIVFVSFVTTSINKDEVPFL